MVFISLLTRVFIIFSYSCVKTILLYYLQLFITGETYGYRVQNIVTSERKNIQKSLLCAGYLVITALFIKT